MNNSQVRDLCLELLGADQEEEVVRLLKKAWVLGQQGRMEAVRRQGRQLCSGRKPIGKTRIGVGREDCQLRGRPLDE